MPTRTTVLTMGLGLLAASILVGLIVLKQRGATPELAGEITSVRTLGMDEASSVAIVDFRFANTSRFPFIVESADMSILDGKGETRKGTMISAAHTAQLFELFPALGAKTNENLILKTKIAPRSTLTVLLTARFEIPKLELDARRKLTITIIELDGAVSEISR